MRRISAILPNGPIVACAHAAASRPRGTMKGLAVAILLASATGVGAQAPRNGPEWGGKDHQPTEAQVLRREHRAGVQLPKAERHQDKRTVHRLDRQFLREEGLDAPRSPAPR